MKKAFQEFKNENLKGTWVWHELWATFHGIIGNVKSLSGSRAILESLLQTREGQKISPNVRAELFKLIETQKEAIQTMNLCIKKQTAMLNTTISQ